MFNKTAFWAIFQFAQRFYLNTVFDHRVHVFHKTWNYFAVHMELWTAMRLNFRTVKVMLYETIHRNTALQCWNNVATIRNNIATMLQCRVTACAKNRCCKSSRVTSHLRQFRVNVWIFSRSKIRPVAFVTFSLLLLSQHRKLPLECQV